MRGERRVLTLVVTERVFMNKRGGERDGERVSFC